MPPYRNLMNWKANSAALLIATVITLVVTAGLHARVAGRDLGKQRDPMPVATARFVEQEGYQRDQRFLGLVQAASRSQVGFEGPGAIAEIHVKEGERVAAGAALASLDTQLLEVRHAAFQSKMEQTSAELELARARRERQAPLKDSGAISAQTFDDTRLAEKALTSRLSASRAEFRAIEIELEKSTLRAPYPALIGRQLLDKGAVTQPGTPVFTLVSSTAREAHIGVSVEQAQHLRSGERYTLEWRDSTVEVVLRTVRPDVNPVSMTTVAIFDLPASVDAFDGEPVTVSLPRMASASGGWLPLPALLEGERGVWTVLALREGSEGAIALREAVEVLYVNGDRAYVRGTVNNGDRVIVDGVHRIAPGTRVESMPVVLSVAQAPT